MADELRADEHDEILFVGTPTGVEARLAPEAGLPFYGLAAKGFDRSRPWTLILALAVLATSLFKALSLVRRFRPDVVVGFGGYVSIPVGLAAVLRGVPLVLQEQNSVPGMANRVLSRWARAVAVTYERSSALLHHPDRAVLTGNPVRASVLEASGEAGRRALGLAPEALVLLVFGGSRGARHINSALVALRDQLMSIENLHVLHIAGTAEAPAVREELNAQGGDAEGRYRVIEYLDAMGDALSASDLVVARAGATSIAEITAVGVASVLVPFPYATEDHQTRNAQTARDAGAAVVVADADLETHEFEDALMGLLRDPERRASMAASSRALAKRDAGERVARLIREVAARGSHIRDGVSR